MQCYVSNAILNLLLLTKVQFFLADLRLLDTSNKGNVASVFDCLFVHPYIAWRRGGFICESKIHCHAPLPILTLFLVAQSLCFFADSRLKDTRNPWTKLYHYDCISLELRTWQEIQYYFLTLIHGQTQISSEGGDCEEILWGDGD